LGGIIGGSAQLELALFHTIFNVATVLAVLPFTNLLIKLVIKLVPQKGKDSGGGSDNEKGGNQGQINDLSQIDA
jgi:Na+/phosphate symporter